MEKEKELALSDLRRIMAEKEALKEKLKVRIDLIDLFLKDNLLRKGEVFLYVFLWHDYFESRSGVGKQWHMSQIQNAVFLYGPCAKNGFYILKSLKKYQKKNISWDVKIMKLKFHCW